MTFIRFTLLLLTVFLLYACGDQSNDNAEQQGDIKIATSPVKAATTSASPIDGQQIYEFKCLPCHAEGPGHPGTMRLAIRSGEDQSVLTKRDNLTADYIKIIVRQGLLEMPPFRPSEITDSELEALADYIAKKES